VEIKVLGPGCPNCRRMEEMTRAAVSELGLGAEIEKVTDIAEIMKHGVMSTPGLVVNGRVKHSGKPLPGPEKLKDMIREEAR
jgi:small redox-active disulfide protein 2